MRCYVDYTCGHSYRAWQWLSRRHRPVEWRTFSLKEVNRDPDEPPAFRDRSSISVLALGLSHAARDHDFDRYHARTFEAFHAGRVSENDLLEIAASAGVPVDSLDRETLFAAVEAEHVEATKRWNVFGTPTFVIDDAGLFLRLSAVPEPDEDDQLWGSLDSLARAPIAKLEITTPHRTS